MKIGTRPSLVFQGLRLRAPNTKGPDSSKTLDWKRSIFIPILKKGSAREYSNYRTVALISHAKVRCSHYVYIMCNAQNSPSQTSAIREP